MSLALAAVLMLAACGEKSSEPAAKPESKPTAAAPAKPAESTASKSEDASAKPAASGSETTDLGDGVTSTVVKTENVSDASTSGMPKITNEGPGDGTAPVTFLGVWAVTDGDENFFNILIFPENRAVSNFWGDGNGPKGETGSYEITGTKCTVKYADGWVDVLSAENGALVKYSFAPGTPTDGTPSNQSQARSVGLPMRPFVGVWQAKLPDPFGEIFVALKSDGTAMSSEMNNGTGTWSVDDQENVAMIEIGNGGPYYTLQPDGDGFKLQAWESGASRTSNPTATAPAMMPGSPTGASFSPPAGDAEGDFD